MARHIWKDWWPHKTITGWCNMATFIGNILKVFPIRIDPKVNQVHRKKKSMQKRYTSFWMSSPISYLFPRPKKSRSRSLFKWYCYCFFMFHPLYVGTILETFFMGSRLKKSVLKSYLFLVLTFSTNVPIFSSCGVCLDCILLRAVTYMLSVCLGMFTQRKEH